MPDAQGAVVIGDRADLPAGADVDAEPVEVAAERCPEGRVVVVAGDVEEQALGRPDEVEVEHGDELGPGELTRVGEEAAGEDLEREVAGLLGEAQPVEDLGRADAVEGDEGVGEVDVEQAERGLDVDRGQPREVEARAAGHEGREVPRRGARDPRERVETTARPGQGVVVERSERLEGRVGAAEDGAQVVVLPEERVEAPAHLTGGPVGQGHRPRADPATEPLVALEQGHPHAALGEGQGRGEAGDAAADDDDVAPAGRCRRADARRLGRRVELGPTVAARPEPRPGAGDQGWAHEGCDPTTVWTTPSCHPGYERWRTSTRPSTSSRSQIVVTASKSRTLV